ncbi:mycofactocin biosynthesis peptidyl-dipeptidase MftE [Nocardioides marmoriginsengisoli]|uniref:Mycofactocin biosynthesis peptidyl-dipeptidase MftE n=1 Tax=Nocardioides marmoriginsengisoli TaxID=661483 RepID=A0A3N0CCX5_9ACTN|nr:mycofactocin biosynthesis peptidyl-dipeptidase MftE [Nocardioides marmoriginsengisoli]RNL61314.1 mycofactocin biosynthesis peptidyl-dipeptidase MftE [Nocardioides marmoriginsengisoli]
MTNLLAESNWPSIRTRPVVLVPLGSTEQHGPHLPFSTDTVIAEAVAKALAAEIEAAGDGPVVLAPAIPYGASGEHQSFPGTSSIGHEALELILVELVRSMGSWSRRVVVVNGHGGNVPTLRTVTERLVDEGHDVGWVSCGTVNGDAHAGHTETSVMLHLAPWSVSRASIAAGNVRPLAELLPDLVAGGVAAVSPTGVLGDPTAASAEQGAVILAEMVARAHDQLLRGASA